MGPSTRWARIRSGASGENNVEGLWPDRPDEENLIMYGTYGNTVSTDSLDV